MTTLFVILWILAGVTGLIALIGAVRFRLWLGVILIVATFALVVGAATRTTEWWLVGLLVGFPLGALLYHARRRTVVLLVVALASVVLIVVGNRTSEPSHPACDNVPNLHWSDQDRKCMENSKPNGEGKPPSSTTTQAPENCVERYNVVLDTNEGNRVVGQGIDVSDPVKAVDQIMALAQHDPRVLVLYWNGSPLGKQSPIDDYNKVVENGCYNQLGRDTFQQTLAQYKSATVTKSEAPADGVNTGVTPGGAPFQEPAGQIGGDREAVQIVFVNGDKVWAMKRCGNLVTETPIPGVPPKPVPPPTTPNTPTPTAPPHSVPPPSMPPPTAPPTTVCREGQPQCPGKNDRNSPVYNPGIPPGIPGCNPNGPTPAGPSGRCTGNPAGPPETVPTNPGPTGCNGTGHACATLPPPATTPAPTPTVPPETIPSTTEPKPIPPTPPSG